MKERKELETEEFNEGEIKIKPSTKPNRKKRKMLQVRYVVYLVEKCLCVFV